EAPTSPFSPKSAADSICDEIAVRSASAWAASIAGLTLTQAILRPVRLRKRTLVQKFFADRGTHLAAMVAYFALLSFVPLTFLALSLLGLTGRADESTFLVRQITHALPGVPIGRIVNLVNSVRRHATTRGIIGGAALLCPAPCSGRSCWRRPSRRCRSTSASRS